jgi:hypothetical protein
MICFDGWPNKHKVIIEWMPNCVYQVHGNLQSQLHARGFDIVAPLTLQWYHPHHGVCCACVCVCVCVRACGRYSTVVQPSSDPDVTFAACAPRSARKMRLCIAGCMKVKLAIKRGLRSSQVQRYRVARPARSSLEPPKELLRCVCEQLQSHLAKVLRVGTK